MNYVFKTIDYDEAGDGELMYEAEFNTLDSGLLTVKMGRKTAITLAAIMLRQMRDDETFMQAAMATADKIVRTE